MKSFSGLNGILYLYDDSVLIIRDSSLGKLFHNKNKQIMIPYKQIRAVEFSPGALVNGYISIVDMDHYAPKNIFSAIKDDSTVIFRFFKNREAEEIKSEIERILLENEH